MEKLSIEDVITYIKNDAEIAVPIERLFDSEGNHITKKEYGLILLEILCEELEKKFKRNKCICGSTYIKTIFIQKGKWIGSSSSNMRRYSLSDERFETREYSLGFDFYAKTDMLKTNCNQCGKTDYIPV